MEVIHLPGPKSLEAGAEVRVIADQAAITAFLSGKPDCYAGREGVVELEVRPGLYRVYFPPRVGHSRGAIQNLPTDLLEVVEPAKPAPVLTLEERVARIEAKLGIE